MLFYIRPCYQTNLLPKGWVIDIAANGKFKGYFICWWYYKATQTSLMLCKPCRLTQTQTSGPTSPLVPSRCVWSPWAATWSTDFSFLNVLTSVHKVWWVTWCLPVTQQSRSTLSLFSCRPSSGLPILPQPSFLPKMGLSQGMKTLSWFSQKIVFRVPRCYVLDTYCSLAGKYLYWIVALRRNGLFIYSRESKNDTSRYASPGSHVLTGITCHAPVALSGASAPHQSLSGRCHSGGHPAGAKYSTLSCRGTKTWTPKVEKPSTQ